MEEAGVREISFVSGYLTRLPWGPLRSNAEPPCLVALLHQHPHLVSIFSHTPHPPSFSTPVPVQSVLHLPPSFLLETGFPLCSPGWPEIYQLDQANLKLLIFLPVLGVQVCTVKSVFHCLHWYLLVPLGLCWPLNPML